MIREADCNLCDHHFRENGFFNTHNAIILHLKQKHTEEWDKDEEMTREANNKLDVLISEYPLLRSSSHIFSLDFWRFTKQK